MWPFTNISCPVTAVLIPIYCVIVKNKKENFWAEMRADVEVGSAWKQRQTVRRRQSEAGIPALRRPSHSLSPISP